MYRTLGCAVVGCLISGFVTRRTTRIKYLIFIVFPVDIKTIYAEFTHVYLRARRCQKACASPGSLVVAGGPQSVTNGNRRFRTNYSSL